MSKYVLILVVFFLPILNVFAQIDDNNENMRHALLAKSDSLFALGVDLYNAGKYQEAIPIFTESDQIDKAVLDSTSNRRNYSAMWLASCYYQLGDEGQAANIDILYKLSPIDRRLTIESDSLLMLLREISDWHEYMKVSKRAADIEEHLLGKFCHWRGGAINNVALSALCLDDFLTLRSTIEEMANIAEKNPDWRGYGFLIETYFLALLKQCQTIEECTLLVETILTILRPTIEEVPLSKHDGYLSFVHENYINVLLANEKYFEALDYIESQYNIMKAKNISNVNMFETISLYAKVLAQIHVAGLDKTEEMDNFQQRCSLYDGMLLMSETLYGKISFAYGNTLFKIANLYLGLGIEIDKTKGRNLLHDAFDILTDQAVCEENIGDVIEVLIEAVTRFDVAEDCNSYLQYANNIIESYSDKADMTLLKRCCADAYTYCGDYRKAAQIYKEIREENTTNEDIVLWSFLNEAHCNRMSNDYEKAIECYTKCDSIYSRNEMDLSPMQLNSHADVLKDLCNLYYKVEESECGISYRKKWMDMKRKIIDNITKDDFLNSYSSYDVIYIIDEFGSDLMYNLYDRNNTFSDLSEAIHYLNMALDLCERLTNWTPKDKNRCLSATYGELGRAYTYAKDFNKALFYINKRMDLSKETNNEWTYANALDDLANLYADVTVEPELSLGYRYMYASSQTEALLKNKNNMTKEMYITMYDGAIQAWDKCAEQHEYLGDSKGALVCKEKELNLIEQVKGCDSEDYAYYLIRLLIDKAEYASQVIKDTLQSRQLIDSVMIVGEKYKEILPTYRSYDHLCRYYYYYCDDISTPTEYLDKKLSELMSEQPDNYIYSKEYWDIQEFRTMSLIDKEEKIGTWKQLAALYKDNKECEYFYYRALLHLSSEYYWTKNKEEELSCEELLLSLFPERHTEEDMCSLMQLYIEMELFEKALSLFNEVSDGMRETIYEKFSQLSENKREWMWASYVQVPFTIGEPLSEMFQSQVDFGTVYDNLLMRKNLLLNSSISAINFIKEEGDSLLISKFYRAAELREALQDTEGDSIYNSERFISREQARALVKRFDDEVMKRAAILGDFTDELKCSWKDVRAELSKEEIAIEFSKYKTFNDSTAYGAAILRSEGYPIFVSLFREDELPILLNDSFEKATEGTIIWGKLNPYIGDAKTIYFSADGLIHNIAIESAPIDSVGMLANDKWNIYRLSSTKQLTKKKHSSLQTSVIYGGLAYNATTADLEEDGKKYSAKRDFDVISFTMSDSLTMRAGVGDLPKSKIEAFRIDSILRTRKIECQLLTDKLGTEASFKDLSGKRVNLIHLATHGFYWTKQDVDKITTISFLKSDNSHEDNIDMSLVRSGLLMSGANHVLKGESIPENVEDGVLTAKEISTLDLRNLDLVVLSACQSGLGEITEEGVFGLQRGFKKAGANSLLMSLWEVDDNATQILMTKFYESLISGCGKNESLKKAQRYLRDEYEIERTYTINSNLTASQRRRLEREGKSVEAQTITERVKPYAAPEYWAAFIMLDGVD